MDSGYFFKNKTSVLRSSNNSGRPTSAMLNFDDNLTDRSNGNCNSSSSKRKKVYSDMKSKKRQDDWKMTNHMNSVSVFNQDIGILNSNDTVPNFNIFSLSKRDSAVYKDIENLQKAKNTRKIYNNTLRRKILSKKKQGSHINEKTIHLDCELELYQREKDMHNMVKHK